MDVVIPSRMGVCDCHVAEVDSIAGSVVGTWSKAEGGVVVDFMGLYVKN